MSPASCPRKEIPYFIVCSVRSLNNTGVEMGENFSKLTLMQSPFFHVSLEVSKWKFSLRKLLYDA